MRKILRAELFESAYKMVRALSGESARVYLEQYAMNDLRKGGTKAEHARRMLRDVFLIGDHGIDEAVRTGRFNQEDMAKAQTAFANQAAFSSTGDPIQMPGMARIETPRIQASPITFAARAIRLTYALQSFSVKATSVFREHLYDEVIVHHNMKPLMYAVIAYPIVGTMLNLTGTGVKHFVHKGIEGLEGKQHSQDSWDRYIAQLEDTFHNPDAVKFLKWYIDYYAISAGLELVKTVANPLIDIASGREAKADSYWLEDIMEHLVGPFYSDIWNGGKEVKTLQQIHAGKKHPELKDEKYEKSVLEFAAEEVPALREIPWVDEKLKEKIKPEGHPHY